MRPLASAPHRGFTLVELLVVIAIIGTLMGLLLPAVQSAREAGRRNTCLNNLKQLGYSVMQHETKTQALPGWRNAHPAGWPTTDTAINDGVSWAVTMLPYLERSDIYRLFEQLPLNSTISGSGGLEPESTRVNISLYRCPSSPLGDRTAPIIAYGGNAGTTLWSGSGTKLLPYIQIRGDGVFYDTVGTPGVSGIQAARTNLDAISSADGTASTLMFSELNSVLAPQPRLWNLIAPDPVIDTQTGLLQNFASVPAFGIASGTFSLEQKVVNSLPYSSSGPNANHPGGVGATMCDGRTMFLRDTIAHHVYAQLLTSGSRWVSGGANGGYPMNSFRMQQWLKHVPPNVVIPYVLQESDL